MAVANEKSTTASAPGKVLLAGGYLVLETPNVGLVVGVDQRFYCTVIESSVDPTTATTPPPSSTKLTVHSPQFHSSWTYHLDPSNQANDSITKNNSDGEEFMKLRQETSQQQELQSQHDSPSKNQFVESTLRLVLAYFWSKNADTQQLHRQLDITIRADNDFYSLLPHLPPPPLDVSTYLSHISHMPRFVPCPLDEITGKPRIHKTGLGSSAALVTSLVAAMYYQYLDHNNNNNNNNPEEQVEVPTNIHLAKIHRLAQLCHCHAQGKVGSGFDVSAAIHGSHVYQKQFPPLFYQLMTLLEQQQQQQQQQNASPHYFPMALARQIQRYVDNDDDEKSAHHNDDGQNGRLQNARRADSSSNVAPITLKAVGLQLILADVSGGGSESPSMARQVLAWKQRQEAEQQQQVDTDKNEWYQLQEINQRIVDLLQQLTETSAASVGSIYQDELQALSRVPASKWKNRPSSSSCGALLYELQVAFQASRNALKSMGDKAGVPIEPHVQTDLCDATMALPGVVAALVPGAGGYDAIACLYIDTPSVREEILQLWLNWNSETTTTTTTTLAPSESRSVMRVLPLSARAVGFGEGLRIESEG